MSANSTTAAARITTRELGAHVVAACFGRDGSQAAFGLADGCVHLAPPERDAAWQRIAMHDGVVMALSPDIGLTGFVSAGDDGVLARLSSAGEISTLFATGGKWIEQLCVAPGTRDGIIACGTGKMVHLFDTAGEKLKTLAHPSTVTGLAFDTRGKRIAASHYNGASVWFTTSKAATPRLLEWKGSHIGITIHPAAEAIVTAMQENALHGWRLADGQHMRMSGYPGKPMSLGFSRNGRWLASSGADAVVLWPFFGGGPMGKEPVELARNKDVHCTRIACHPKDDLVAAGYADGTVLITEIARNAPRTVQNAVGSPISALCWSADGRRLAFGTATGLAKIFDLV